MYRTWAAGREEVSFGDIPARTTCTTSGDLGLALAGLLDLAGLCDAGHTNAVLLLDGEFGQSFAVSIAEVRAVLDAGMPLHGASSMGVLRAVECRTLGMTGSGWVYERYLFGDIDSDADVALMFDPESFEKEGRT